ncbi:MULTISPECIES: pilus assembly FimT family protein [Shewanella]|uniref:pilus assembly FimT family protein n=1 Tax=Shewanella TaxID=22 RepID=UPI00217CDD3E|nr:MULTISPECIES: type II secretion system protein [Shewanella]MCS6191613.1 type II secretion system protein [Shewanella baltica]
MMLVSNRRAKGFTLIELLVILVIMGILLSLVGPLAVENVDKVTIKTEEKQFKNWLVKTSFSAFNRGVPLTITLHGHQVVAFTDIHSEQPDAVSAMPIDSITFDGLFFQPQTFLLNKNGFPSQQTVEYQLLDKQFSINIQQMMQR